MTVSGSAALIERPDPRRPQRSGWTRTIVTAWRRPGAQLTVLLAALIIYGAVFTPDFLTELNLYGVMQASMPSLIVGLGASLALYAGIADLSIGSMVGVSAIAFAVTQEHGWPTIAGLLTAVACGVAVGLLNSVAVVNFHADSLIVTLGTLSALRGVVYTVGGNESKVAVSPMLENVAAQRIGPVPVVFGVLVIVFALVALYLSRARIGRHIQAAGGDHDAAVRAGIPARRIQRGLLIATATLSAVAGLVYVGLLDSAPITLGNGLELQIYAAILISGFSLTNGGIGNPMVTVAGLMAFAVLSNLIGLGNIDPSWQDVVTGALLVTAVGLDVLRRKDKFE